MRSLTQHLWNVGLNIHILQMLVRVCMIQSQRGVQADRHPHPVPHPGHLPHLRLFPGVRVERVLKGNIFSINRSWKKMIFIFLELMNLKRIWFSDFLTSIDLKRRSFKQLLKWFCIFEQYILVEADRHPHPVPHPGHLPHLGLFPGVHVERVLTGGRGVCFRSLASIGQKRRWFQHLLKWSSIFEPAAPFFNRNFF